VSEGEIARLRDELRAAGDRRARALEAALATDASRYTAPEWEAYDEAVTDEAEAYVALRDAMDRDEDLV
jgi:hypothetical protein